MQLVFTVLIVAHALEEEASEHVRRDGKVKSTQSRVVGIATDEMHLYILFHRNPVA